MGRSQGKPNRPAAPPTALVPDDEGNASARELMAMASTGIVKTSTGYQTAVVVQKPRNLMKVRDAVVQEAMWMGEDFLYAWEVKDKNSPTGRSLVDGISIDGAMVLLRNWTNAACPPRIVEDGPTHWVFEAEFIDLEAGFTCARLYRARKSTYGKYEDERAMDIAFQIGMSKCQRNAILKGIPLWLQKAAKEAALAAAEKSLGNAKEARAKVLAGFAPLGIDEVMLERKLGKKLADWVPRDIIVLRAVYASIKNGQSTVSEEFSPAEEATVEPQQPPAPDVIDVTEVESDAAPDVDADAAPEPGSDG